MILQILVLVACCFYVTTRTEAAGDFDNPILPKQWQKLAGTGFSTNYFKTTRVGKKYHAKNIQDVYDKGFRNLRLRCRTGLKNLNMEKFLVELNMVVDECLKVGVVPIISWINHIAEAEGKDEQMKAYVKWWTKVAVSLQDKDYRLAFNLFTELGVKAKCGKKDCVKSKCPYECGESLAENLNKYKDWTREVIPAIRNAGGNNKKRIIILGAPAKTGDTLKDIPSEFYEGDDYMMAEWHIFASGPNKKHKRNGKASIKYWGIIDGKDVGKANVDQSLTYAKAWTKKTGVETYFGAWMPQDNEKGQITTKEAEEFSKYFIEKVKPLPWSLNVLDVYYNTKTSTWKPGKQKILGMVLDMPEILKVIEDTMKKPARKDESFEDIPRMNAYWDNKLIEDTMDKPARKDESFEDIPRKNAFWDKKVTEDTMDKPQMKDENFEDIQLVNEFSDEKVIEDTMDNPTRKGENFEDIHLMNEFRDNKAIEDTMDKPPMKDEDWEYNPLMSDADMWSDYKNYYTE